jgi:hypothetical protein
MQMPKPTEADRERFRALVPDDPRVEVKPMFGQLAAFVNGNMFFGLFGSDLGVKVSPEKLAELRARAVARSVRSNDRWPATRRCRTLTRRRGSARRSTMSRRCRRRSQRSSDRR